MSNSINQLNLNHRIKRSLLPDSISLKDPPKIKHPHNLQPMISKKSNSQSRNKLKTNKKNSILIT